MRRQLVLGAVALSTLIVLAFVVPFGWLIRTLAEDRALTNAERRAQVLVPVLGVVTDPDELVAAISSSGDDRSSLTVYLPDGTVLGAALPADDAVALARTGRSFRAATAGGTEILVPVLGADGRTAVIRVVVPDSTLHRGVATAWLLLAGLGTLLVALATVLADRMARAVTGPAAALAYTAERLGHGDRAARAEPAGPPELVEIATTLNRLADRIDELVQAEREQVADLSHRLRTPVTALRLDVDALPAGAERERLVADVDALSAALDRVIVEARRVVEHDEPPRTELVGATRDRVAFWQVLAEDQGRSCSLSVPGGERWVAASGEDVDDLFDSLLGNVFAHTDEGVGFAVTLDDTAGTDGRAGVRLLVDDAGSGFASDAVLARGTSGGGSTGLGLDIARRVAESTGGTMTTGASPQGGARIEIVLPVVDRPG